MLSLSSSSSSSTKKTMILLFIKLLELHNAFLSSSSVSAGGGGSSTTTNAATMMYDTYSSSSSSSSTSSSTITSPTTHHHRTVSARSRRSRTSTSSSIKSHNNNNDTASSSSSSSSSPGTTTTTNNNNNIQQHPSMSSLSMDYTSPPLQDAIDATPIDYRDDTVIQYYRNAAANNLCNNNGDLLCHIPFVPPSESNSEVGVIYYGGAMIDPRSYSVLASRIVQKYNLPVVVPIFANDLSFNPTVCNSQRIVQAQKQFPYVKKWIFVGHSFGAIGAMTDVWTIYNEEQQQQSKKKENDNTDSDNSMIGGLVMMSADVQQLTCGLTDFSQTKIPMSMITGSNDLLLNRTRFHTNKKFTSGTNYTWFLDVQGGTHNGFGSYDFSERGKRFNKYDGEQAIPVTLQWDIAISAIYHVATRIRGVTLPPQPASVITPTNHNNNNNNGSNNKEQPVIGCSFLSSSLLLSSLSSSFSAMSSLTKSLDYTTVLMGATTNDNNVYIEYIFFILTVMIVVTILTTIITIKKKQNANNNSNSNSNTNVNTITTTNKNNKKTVQKTNTNTKTLYKTSSSIQGIEVK